MKTFARDQKMPAYRTPGHDGPLDLTSDVAKECQTISTVDGLTILSIDNDDLTTLNTSSRAALQRYLDADLSHDGRYKATEITRYLRKHHDLIQEHAELLTALVMANTQTTDAATLNDFVNTLGLTGETIARDHEAINALLSHALNDRLDTLTTPPATSSFQAMFKLYMLMDRRGEGLFYYQDIHTFLNNTFSLSSKYSDLLVEYVIDHSDYRGYATPKEFFNTLGLTCGSLALDHRAIGIKLAELLVDQSEFQTDTETDTVHYACVDDIDDDNQRATHTLFTHVEISRFLQDNFHINEPQGDQLSDFILSRSSHGDSATFEELKQILGFSETTLMDAHDEVQRLLKR